MDDPDLSSFLSFLFCVSNTLFFFALFFSFLFPFPFLF